MKSSSLSDVTPLLGGVRELLDRHGVNALGCALVDSVRSGPPARTVQGRVGNVTGRYPSRKMGRTIQYESRTVECAFVVQSETDPTVLEYFDQPCTLPLEYSSRAGRRVVVNHTPDFLVLGTEFVGLVECKAVEKLRKLVDEAPGRYVADGEAAGGALRGKSPPHATACGTASGRLPR